MESGARLVALRRQPLLPQNDIRWLVLQPPFDLRRQPLLPPLVLPRQLHHWLPLVFRQPLQPLHDLLRQPLQEPLVPRQPLPAAAFFPTALRRRGGCVRGWLWRRRRNKSSGDLLLPLVLLRKRLQPLCNLQCLARRAAHVHPRLLLQCC
jgi:hypothetical protein